MQRQNHSLPGALLLVGVVALAWTMLVTASRPEPASLTARRGPGAIDVPAGFQVERVAGPGLVSYPMLGTVDDRGRLWLCESNGVTVKTPEMKASPAYRIRLVEDVNGDGVYDRSSVFAEKLTLPAGAVWLNDSLYVAAPPDLLRFRDTNGDGVADQREVILTGWNLSANAASLHGPILGPDGWLYLTDGRHGYKIRTKEGPILEGRASRVWRARPDGTGLEWVSGGGFDNPVEVVFTPAGEMIGTMTYFTDPRDGERDALLHFVEGGVYPKPHPVVSEFAMTGDFMPVMTRFARIAPSGLLRYRGSAWGADFHGNLFSAQFNTHRIQRHVMAREGASFRTRDEDFLVSWDPDFHPTDVMEDADGSILVVDTGAWFIHGCPVSRVSKPQIRGGIYRIRKKGAAPAPDPRGQALRLAAAGPEALARALEDPRPAVHDEALERLVRAPEPVVAALRALRASSTSVQARCSAVFAMFRIGSPAALESVRDALDDPHLDVRVAAARSLGMARDRLAVSRLVAMARRDEPAARRQAATALGQIGERGTAPALLAAAADAEDRFLEHAIIHSLLLLGDPAPLAAGLRHPSARVRKAALISLDQMKASPIQRGQALPFLADADPALRRAALWVVSHHADWAADVVRSLDARLRSPQWLAEDQEKMREAVVAFCPAEPMQKAIAGLLADSRLDLARRRFLVSAIDGCAIKEFPASWLAGLRLLLESADPELRLRVTALVRTREIAGLDQELLRISESASEPDLLRTTALGALILRRPGLPDEAFSYLLGLLRPGADAPVRLAAAAVASRAELTQAQQILLAARLPGVDPLLLPNLIEAFRAAAAPDVGQALVAGLSGSQAAAEAIGLPRLERLFQNFPGDVRAAAVPLVERFRREGRARDERLRKLEPLLTTGGDHGRGRQVFFGEKAACSSCHTIGAEGGHVGPDLTAVGAVRSGHDLLESIVFPSATFVPGHEVYRVHTASDVFSGVLARQSPEAVTLVTGPNDEVRLPRSRIVKMEQSEVSLMPDGFDEVLTQTELADLLAFLREQTSRPQPARASR